MTFKPLFKLRGKTQEYHSYRNHPIYLTSTYMKPFTTNFYGVTF